jgi:hypothetical protein
MNNHQKRVLKTIIDWLKQLETIRHDELSDNQRERFYKRSAKGTWDIPEIDGSRQQLNHEIWSYLNDIGMKTERGKEWNSSRWKDFRKTLNKTKILEWLEDNGIYQPDLGNRTQSQLFWSMMKKAQSDGKAEIRRLTEAAKIDSQVWGRKRKRHQTNNDRPTAHVVAQEGDTPKRNKLEKKMISLMKSHNLKPQMWIINMMNGR